MQIITHFGDNVNKMQATALKMAYVSVRKVQTGTGAHPAPYTMDTRSLPAVKRPGRGVDNPPPSSAEVKEKVGLYIYFPSGSSTPVVV